MAKLAILAETDIQQTVYPEKVTRQLHVMASRCSKKFAESLKQPIISFYIYCSNGEGQ